MIEFCRNLGIKDLARAGFAAVALIAAGEINPAYADSQCGNKAVAQFNDMVVSGVENVDPRIHNLCPPETWKVVNKTVFPVSHCYRESPNASTRCYLTGYYQFHVTCEGK